MLRQLDSSLWVNEVPFKLFGIDFGNRMTCIQLSDSSFWLHSPTKFDQTTHQEIKAKGNIKYLVTPSLMHNLFVMDWKEQSTDYQVLAPAKAKKIRPDLYLDELSEESLCTLFNDEITCIPINGVPVIQEYAFVHHASKTLVLTDLAFNFGSDISRWSRLFLTLYGAYNKFGPSVAIRSLVKDKNAFGESIDKIACHNFDRVIVSHGDIIENDGNAVFNDAFKKYLRMN